MLYGNNSVKHTSAATQPRKGGDTIEDPKVGSILWNTGRIQLRYILMGAKDPFLEYFKDLKEFSWS